MDADRQRRVDEYVRFWHERRDEFERNPPEGWQVAFTETGEEQAAAAAAWALDQVEAIEREERKRAARDLGVPSDEARLISNASQSEAAAEIRRARAEERSALTEALRKRAQELANQVMPGAGPVNMAPLGFDALDPEKGAAALSPEAFAEAVDVMRRIRQEDKIAPKPACTCTCSTQALMLRGCQCGGE